MTLELADGGIDTFTAHMYKVVNPANPSQVIYLREDIYRQAVENANEGMSGFFSNLWSQAQSVIGTVVNTVKGFIGKSGGGSSSGGSSSGGFNIPILGGGSASGQPNIVLNVPNAPPAAVHQDTVTGEKDNTTMYLIGGGALLAVAYLAMK